MFTQREAHDASIEDLDEYRRARHRLQTAEDERDRLRDERVAAERSEQLGADVRALAAEDEVAARARWLEWADAQEASRFDGPAPGPDGRRSS